MSRSFKTNYLRKQRQRYFKRFLLFFIFLTASGLLVYFIIFSNAFSVNEVKIIGLKRIPENTIKNEIESTLNEFKILPINKNLIFFKANQIKNIFVADIETIRVTKNFFTKTLNVYVTEKQPIAQLIFDNENDSAFVETNRSDIYLDNTGRIFKSELLRQDKFIKIIINQPQSNAPKSLWDQEKINNFRQLVDYVNQQAQYKDNFYFEYSLNTPSAVMVDIKNYFKVYLTLNNQIVDAFSAADKFYLVDSQKKSLITNYIDMRYYPEKLYYK